MDVRTSYTRSHDLAAVGQPSVNRNIVRFFVEAVKHEAETEKAGRPIFHDIEMIEIIVPGDMKSIAVRRATPQDRNDYPRAYEAHKRNEEMATDGTPIEHWNMLTRSQVATLKSVNIYTIEQLAGLDDGKLQGVGILGSRTLRKQAQVYLSQAADGAEAAKLVTDNERQAQELTHLRNQLATASASYEALAKEKGVDASAVTFSQHAHPAQQVASAPAPVATVSNELPAGWRDLPAPELMKLARSLSPAPVKNKADALSVLAEIEGEKAAA